MTYADETAGDGTLKAKPSLRRYHGSGKPGCIAHACQRSEKFRAAYSGTLILSGGLDLAKAEQPGRG